MRLLVASDLHGSMESLSFLLHKAHQFAPDALVLLGDLVYHGPRNPLPQGYDTRSVLQTMPDLTALPCPVIAVRGNCDAEVDLGLLPFAVTESTWIEADCCAAIPMCHAAKPLTACTSGTPVRFRCPRGAHPALTA